MRRTFLTLITLMLLLVPGRLSWAADNPGDKFTRGVVNIISAPIEIAKQIDTEWKATQVENAEKPKKNKTIGVFTGLFKGLAYTVARMGSGAWDVITFPFKVPENYDPLLKPEYVLDKPESK